MLVLPFDSHNHVHLGPSPPLLALVEPNPNASHLLPVVSHGNRHKHVPTKDDYHNNDELERSSNNVPALLSGMALMSTHPRDYDRVLRLARELPLQVWTTISPPLSPLSLSPPHSGKPPFHVIPCLGVHPWFLHELSAEDWESPATAFSESNRLDDDNNLNNDATIACGTTTTTTTTVKSSYRWIQELENRLRKAPSAIVGEIGLDAFHYDPVSKKLVSPMETQVAAVTAQLDVATRLRRPVCIHCVHSWGLLMEIFASAKDRGQKQQQQHSKQQKKPVSTRPVLPPYIYFHAFGGKVGTVKQLLSLCSTSHIYFGFAAIVNFRNPEKTANVLQMIGLDRLLLESDHEDAVSVRGSLEQSIQFIARVLNVDRTTVIEKTTRNAAHFYGFLNDAETQGDKSNVEDTESTNAYCYFLN